MFGDTLGAQNVRREIFWTTDPVFCYGVQLCNAFASAAGYYFCIPRACICPIGKAYQLTDDFRVDQLIKVNRASQAINVDLSINPKVRRRADTSSGGISSGQDNVFGVGTFPKRRPEGVVQTQGFNQPGLRHRTQISWFDVKFVLPFGACSWPCQGFSSAQATKKISDPLQKCVPESSFCIPLFIYLIHTNFSDFKCLCGTGEGTIVPHVGRQRPLLLIH